MILNTIAKLEKNTHLHVYVVGGHVFQGRVVSVDADNYRTIIISDVHTRETTIDIGAIIAISKIPG